MGQSFENFLYEFHLYKNKVESLIKDLIWTISWLGGIFILQGINENKTLGSAYLIFSLSLLMEFACKIVEKQMCLSRIIHTIFCLLCVVTLLISIALLVGAPIKEDYYSALFNIPVIILIWMWIDTIILWFKRDFNFDKVSDCGVSNKNNEKDKTTEIFEKKLSDGALGTVSGMEE